ncbi:MAG: GNAT family N-acetyltransferase [Clostridia bacterium]|nr:GNAT family N-acetyltransferase [Clostridia bacterium]
MNVKLIKLTKEYEKQLGEMIDEWRTDQELNHTNHSPYVIFKNDYHDFDFYLEDLETKEPTDRKVPDSVFFLLDTDRNRLLGAVNIRHYLNDALLFSGGHIGDGIRPSERGKGYGTEIIRLALVECKKLGIDKVLMTYDKDNIASAKTIINNGGVLESEFINEDGEIEQRYWIDLSDE